MVDISGHNHAKRGADGTWTRQEPVEFQARCAVIIPQASPVPKESSINSNPCHLQSSWSASRILSLAFSTRVFFLYQNICTGKKISRVEMSISRYHWQVGCFDASNSFSKFGKARVIVPLLYTYVQSATFSLLGVCVFMCVRE